MGGKGKGALVAVGSNKRRVHELYTEVINERDFQKAGRFIAEGIVENDKPAGTEDREGRAVFDTFFSALHETFPEFQFEVTIENMVAENDIVAVPWKATGTHISTFGGIGLGDKAIEASGTDRFRLKDDKIVEHWGDWGDSAIRQRLDAASSPESTAVDAAKVRVQEAKVRVQEAKVMAEAARVWSVEAAQIKVEEAKIEAEAVSLVSRLWLERRRLDIAENEVTDPWRLLLRAAALALVFLLAAALARIGHDVASDMIRDTADGGLVHGWAIAIVALAAPVVFAALVAAGAVWPGRSTGGQASGGRTSAIPQSPAASGTPAPSQGSAGDASAGGGTSADEGASAGVDTQSGTQAPTTVQAGALSFSREPALYTLLGVAAVDALLVFGPLEETGADPLRDALVVALNGFALVFIRSRVKPVTSTGDADVVPSSRGVA